MELNVDRGAIRSSLEGGFFPAKPAKIQQEQHQNRVGRPVPQLAPQRVDNEGTYHHERQPHGGNGGKRRKQGGGALRPEPLGQTWKDERCCGGYISRLQAMGSGRGPGMKSMARPCRAQKKAMSS